MKQLSVCATLLLLFACGTPHPKSTTNAFDASEEIIQLMVKDLPIEQLRKKRAEALKLGTLLGGKNDWVDAVLVHNGKSKRAKIRLKGYLSDHWNDEQVYVGAIGGHHADLSIEYSRIDNVHGQPFYTEYGSTVIRYTKMRTKISSDIVNVKYGKAIIEYCELQGNNQPNTDGIDYDNILDGIIRGNNIYNFIGGNSDGIDLGEGAIDVFIEKNRIVNCSDKGISVGQKSTAKIFRNVIIGCNQGVGIKDSSSFAIIDKCVFYRNNVAIAVFEKNNNHGGGGARVTNTIISQSKNASVQVDEYSSLDITYSLSDMDLMKGEGNLYADPMFQSPGTGEFTLRDESPCLNSGTRKSFLDLGKARNQMGLGVAEKKIKVHLVYYLILGALGMAGMYAFGK